MMRKDVKIGFVVGGILIAVLIIYVLVVPGDKRNPNVELSQGGNGDTGAVVPDQGAIQQNPAVGVNQPLQVAGTADGKSVDPFEPNKPVDSNDKWMLALNNGQVPLLTATPDVGARTNPLPRNDSPNLQAPVADKPLDNGAIQNGAAPVTTPPENRPPVNDPTILLPNNTTIPADPTTRPSGMRTHVIQRGETLAKIAEVVYGSQNHWPVIAKANPNVDPSKMKPGVTIVLPPLDAIKKSEPAPKTDSLAGTHAVPVDATIDPKTQYQIQSGDSLHKIALKLYGKESMWEKIYELNKEAIGGDPAKLKLKTILKLPEPPSTKQ